MRNVLSALFIVVASHAYGAQLCSTTKADGEFDRGYKSENVPVTIYQHAIRPPTQHNENLPEGISPPAEEEGVSRISGFNFCRLADCERYKAKNFPAPAYEKHGVLIIYKCE